MHFHLVTLFPKSFDSYLGESILKRAIEDRKIKVSFYNPRDFVENKWTKSAKGGLPDQQSWFRKRVDRPPYGGGPGLVIEALPIVQAIESAIKKSKLAPRTKSLAPKIIFLSPRGKQFTNDYAKKTIKKYKNIILVCGRYEGIDARVKKIFKMEEISVGPFVLTGGELPAMLIMDVMSRQVPGILGNINSLEEHRVSTSEIYTRPEVFNYKGKSYRVPKILLSGNHAEIEKWKRERKK
ncbi:MAG: tRNA (guanosine(37)-N1)-methyltransferase TrmD [Candidatus Zambryskibacteria bacterium]|nr:tRNA (guanosine(37)-N1)-methyltransferase TrmD [Candidatus Zambryskibacteria bacterium]